jgi:hypothetical protein
MKKIFLINFFVSLTMLSFAQHNSDIGIFAGISSYMGDINPKKYFYSPSPAYGGLYRYNINKRYALRLNVIYSTIKGSDLDFPNIYHPDRPNVSFSTSLLNLGGNFEFNFLPYAPTENQWDYSTYITAGLGYSVIMNSTANAKNHVNIPFGVGIKVNITDRLSSGAELTFHKTFTDTLDGVAGPLEKSLVHNNDWYSFIGVFITYKFFKFAAKCPAYN